MAVAMGNTRKPFDSDEPPAWNHMTGTTTSSAPLARTEQPGLRTCPNCKSYRMFEPTEAPFTGNLACTNCSWIIKGAVTPAQTFGGILLRPEAMPRVEDAEQTRRLYLWSHPPPKAAADGWKQEAKKRAALAYISMGVDAAAGSSHGSHLASDFRKVVAANQVGETEELIARLRKHGVGIDESKVRHIPQCPTHRGAALNLPRPPRLP